MATTTDCDNVVDVGYICEVVALLRRLSEQGQKRVYEFIRDLEADKDDNA